MGLSDLFEMLKNNVSLTRRKACQMGGMLGLSFSAFGPFLDKAYAEHDNTSRGEKPMKLPSPTLDGTMSLEAAVRQRRTIRSFLDRPVTLEQFSQILWAAQGITEDHGFKRAAPSGGALYPTDVYAVVGTKSVARLAPGVYRYRPANHFMEKMADGDRRADVAVASLRQMWMATAAVLLVVTAQYSRITIKYGDRGIRYALIEVGHIGQNIFLQCQALGLAAGIVGAFNDKEVTKAVNAPGDHEPLIIMPVGWKAV